MTKWLLVCSKDTNRMVGVFCFLKNYEFVAILVCSYIMVKYAVCVNTYRRCMIELTIFD